MKQHYEQAEVAEIARSLGLTGVPELLPTLGMVNEVWRVENAVIRICTDEEAERDAKIEEIVVPLAIQAEVRTPKLIHADHSQRLVDGSYTVYERVEGQTIGELDANQGKTRGAFVQIGREIAKLHRLPKLQGDPMRLLTKPEFEGIAAQLEKAEGSGLIDSADRAWIEAWFCKLKPEADPILDTIVHNDLHPWNVMAKADTAEFVAIIDWGDAGYGHPAFDFIGTPLWCIPPMLDGYVEEGGTIEGDFIPVLLSQWMVNALWDGRCLPGHPEYARKWWRWPPNVIDGVKQFFEKDCDPRLKQFGPSP